MLKRLATFVAMMIVMVAAGASAADSPANEPGKVITQGDFAVLYAKAIALKEPAEGYTPQTASEWLSSFKNPIAPVEGWVLDEALTEKVMVHLVKRVGVFISPSNPDALVTVAKANLVFVRYGKEFKAYLLVRQNTGNSTDALVYDVGDVAGVSGFKP